MHRFIRIASAEQETALEATAELQASLNLAEGPLLRVALLDLDNQPNRLLLVIHHLVDGSYFTGGSPASLPAAQPGRGSPAAFEDNFLQAMV